MNLVEKMNASKEKETVQYTIVELFEMLKEKVAEIERKQAEIDLLKRLIEIKDRVRDEQQAKIDDLEKQLDMMKYINDEQSKNMQNAFKTIEIEQGFKDELQKRIDGVSQVLCELKESMGGFKEMDLYDKGYRVTTEYVIADLEQALRGEHD